MVFSSIIFLFLFLPITLLLYYLAGKNARNIVLLLMSLVFYTWGEQFYVVVMLVSICLNYLVGILIDRAGGQRSRLYYLLAGVIANLFILAFFKYSGFLVRNINAVLELSNSSPLDYPSPHLPIGISFFTFQALSYIVDVYKQTATVQQNVFSLGLYIASFPQLIAGPIVRYHDVARQIIQRTHSAELFARGVERFIFGLSKKVLIANPMGAMADAVFVLKSSELSTGAAWIGIFCYTLQIYFDFSGYSDMAIGLGRMFGFRFLENFNFPYISRSIREFWRRWHISLSNWLRDYLYIPLGGNRKGRRRTAFNLLVVFILCGLWHGASWNFILWGLVYGILLVAERGRFGDVLQSLPVWVQHGYVLVVVVNAWVLFRVESIKAIGEYFAIMYGNADAMSMPVLIALKFDQRFMVTFAAGILFSLPVYPFFRKKVRAAVEHYPIAELPVFVVKFCLLGSLLFLAVSRLAVGSYNPFIYFRF